MNIYIKKFCLLTLIVLVNSCSSDLKKIDDFSSYLVWLNDEANGLVKTKYINGMKISMKYLSPEYLVYKDSPELSSSTTNSKNDSLTKAFGNSLSFLLNISPDERKEEGVSVTNKNINSYQEYAERMHTMNFEMERFFLLKTEANEFKPVLSSMENTYEMTKGRNIILVFAPYNEDQKSDFYNSTQLDIVYRDELFDTGISHFVFNRVELTNASKILSLQGNNKT